jgi:hypothetical protein
MKFFKKNQQNINPKSEALAVRIAGRIIQRQIKLANFLNRKTQHWNRTAKLTALVLFLLVFGALSCYYIIKSL